MNLNKISDSALLAEYNYRFEIKTGQKLNGSMSVSRHVRPLYKRDVEQMVVMFLNAQNAVITTETIFSGSLTSTAIYPREIIKRCLELEAAAIIISHNHPSGANYPSKEDIKITDKIKNACKTMDIQVHDHVIIAKDAFYSFADEGMI